MEKTCGNCNIDDFDLMRCDYFDDNGEHEAITKNKPACEDWIKRVLTDEERYQQLAEVARKMLKHLCSVCDGGDVYNEDIADYREGLEKLGVEV